MSEHRRLHVSLILWLVRTKHHGRSLDEDALAVSSKIRPLAVAVRVVSNSVLAFFRVWAVGQLSGMNSSAAMLIAGLAAIARLISAWLALRDDSPRHDDP
ncbi:MAG TPA: hypothetical protein VIY28_15190 [Pseudonocardiaceae bacterium]